MPTTTPRKASRRSSEEVRALVVGAAGDLFAERGYAQTTMRDVASAAGIGLSVLYRHFESKERLFSATFVAPFLESFEHFRAHDGQLVGEFIRDLHQNLGEHRRTVITLLAALEEPGTELIDEVRSALGEAWLNLQLAAPGPVSERSRDANMLVVAMVVGLVLFRPWIVAARDGDDQPLVELADVFCSAGLRMATRARRC